jgi:excinuclease ABC subunit A
MVFLADVFMPCEVCGGTRFKREVLEVKIRGHSIADVLEFTVDEAIMRFRHQPSWDKPSGICSRSAWATSASASRPPRFRAGEAQRLKIARELAQSSKRGGRKLYILDEPTTGLHLDDVRVLIQVLDRLVDAGHTVLVIEHHLDVIKRADWIIDLGPEAERPRWAGGRTGNSGINPRGSILSHSEIPEGASWVHRTARKAPKPSKPWQGCRGLKIED